MEGFADLADLPEDERIKIIGRTVMLHGKSIAVPTDDEPGKAERYIQKLKERFPGIQIGPIKPGPVKRTVCFTCRPPHQSN